MSFKEINRLCVCSHIREKHTVNYVVTEDPYGNNIRENLSICWGCYAPGSKLFHRANHLFKLDNLAYLMEKYENKI